MDLRLAGWALIVIGLIVILDGIVSLAAFLGMTGSAADLGRVIRVILGGIVVYIGKKILDRG